MRKHTGERPYACKICGMTFSQLGILNNHSLVHKGEESKNHKCHLCSKTFRSDFSINYMSVAQIHFERIFRQKFHLKVHLQRHEGVRRFLCEHCQASFLTTSDFKRHMRTHTGSCSNIYFCPLQHSLHLIENCISRIFSLALGDNKDALFFRRKAL